MKQVVVIGSGIIGCSSAWYLSKAGYEVTVIEQNQVSDWSGCSYVNCGYLTPSHFVPLAAPGVVKKGLKWMRDKTSPLHIDLKWEKELLRWLWLFASNSNQRHVDRTAATMLALNLKSKELYKKLPQDGVNVELHESGMLILAATEKGLTAEYALADQAVKMGLKPVKLGAPDLQRYEPNGRITAAGGVFYPEDAFVHPKQVMLAFRKSLRAAGVKFLFETKVEDLSFGSDHVAVHLDKEVLRPDHVVIATGSWSSDWNEALEISLPLQAGKGYSMDATEIPFEIKHPIILSEAKIALTPYGDVVRVGGTMEINGRNMELSPERMTAIKDNTATYFPEIRKYHFRHAESHRGLRPLSPDGMPYIGNLRHRPNVTIATGHAMVGMSLGPVTGQIVAQLVQGETPEFNMDLLHPQRFDR